MIYTIKAIRSKDIVWTGGTFRKYEVKTAETGDEILELKLSPKKMEKMRAGDIIEGYTENSTYNGRNGPVTVKVLRGISAEYVYKLLLKLAPDIESRVESRVGVKQAPVVEENQNWDASTGVDSPVDQDSDIGF